MNKSEQINELAAALAKAQGAIQGAVKDSTNPFFKSNYADLASVWGSCRKALCENGLAVIQTTDEANLELVTVQTTLTHSSGQWVSGSLSMKPVKADPQGIGSAISYARRYALAAMVGIYQEDDDANKATGEAAAKPLLKMPLKQPESVPAAQVLPDGSPAAESLAVRLQKALEGLVELTGREPFDILTEFSSFDEKKGNVKTGKKVFAGSIDQLVKKESWGHITLKRMETALEPPREAGEEG